MESDAIYGGPSGDRILWIAPGSRGELQTPGEVLGVQAG